MADDPPIVREFKSFGRQLVMDRLHHSAAGFVDKDEIYREIVEGFKDRHGWPEELTRQEKSTGGMREVYINRLHWIAASLAADKKTEKSSGKPYIALKGREEAAKAAYGNQRIKRRAEPEERVRAKLASPAVELERALSRPADLPLNLILYGPPGTGKTRKMLEYRARFADGSKRRYEMVTFHPSYSYEEFIEGLRPVIQHKEEEDASGARTDMTTRGDARAASTVDLVRYEVVPGVFKRICRRAALDPDKPYALFVDEINRGNVPALFGELITLIEEDKRGIQVTLAYSAPRGRRDSLPSATSESEEERFSVPPNLHIIGTMNTADRSIALLDVALRRRFEFEEIGIDYDALENELGQVRELREEGLDVAKILRRMNERICYLYDRDHQIGHGWLIQIRSLAELRDAFYYKIIPLLVEYFYDGWAKVCSVLGEHPEQARSTDLIEKKRLSAENLFGRAQGRSEVKWTYSVGDRQTWTSKHFAKIAGVLE